MTSSVSSPAMVGRQADLTWLQNLLDDARAGAPRTVVLGGEAGIGKTRLLREFRDRLDPGVRYLAGQCVDLGSVASPYAPVKAALRTLVAEIGAEAAVEAVGPGRAVLVGLLPELDDPEASDRPAAEGAFAAGQLHEAIAVLLESVSRECATVFVIEDLHWVDAASLALLRFLMRALTSSRVLIVLTYRTEDVGRGHPLRSFLSEVERDRWVDRRELDRLTRAQSLKLARRLLPVMPSDTALESIVQRSEGVPFFVEELVSIDGCRERALPDTLRDLLLARYERLGDDAQEVLRLIATGGVRVAHDLLAAVHAGEADALDRAAREAVLAGVLTIDGDDYAFRHALVREAILADALPGERARFHARYATALEQAGSRRRVAAEISFHWLGAHDSVRAFPATIQAMREARASAAFSTAGQLGERAVSLWDVVPEPEQVAGMTRIELMGRTATYLRNAGDSERALALVRAAIAECAPGDPQIPRLLRDEAFVLANLARPGAIELLEQALELMDDDAPYRPAALTGLAGRLMIDGRADEAIAAAEQAVEVAAAAGSDRYVSVATNIAATARAERGDVLTGLDELERARELARGDGQALLRYWVNVSDLMHLVGRFDEAVRLAEVGLARAKEEGLERSSGVILASNAVDPLMSLGEWERADRLIERSLGLAASTSFEMYVQRARIWSLLWRGDLDAAVAVLREARDGLDAVMEVELQARLGVGRVLTELALERSDLEGAWREAQRLVSEEHLLHPGYALPYLWAAGRVIGAIRRAAASSTGAASSARSDAVLPSRDEIERFEARLRELIDGIDWPSSTIWRALFDAELADSGAPGSEAAAVARWRAAVDAVDVPEAPVVVRSYAPFRLGAALVAAGDRTAARAELQRAFRVADDTGVRLVREHVESFAADAGLAVGDAAVTTLTRREGTVPDGAADRASDPTAELTSRERQVLELIAEGLSNRQIGERLYISGKTASVHVSAILRKLGASSRTEAAVRAGALR